MNRVLYIVILLCFSATCTYAADGAWGKKKKKKAATEKTVSNDSLSKSASESEIRQIHERGYGERRNV